MQIYIIDKELEEKVLGPSNTQNEENLLNSNNLQVPQVNRNSQEK